MRAKLVGMQRYFVVAGDFHLERAQYGLPVRYQDNQQCVEVILGEVCSRRECLGLILTGDTFHRKSLLPRYQIQLQKIARRLKAAGKELAAIDGNHDVSDASWLDSVDPHINGNGRVLKLGNRTGAFFSFQPRESLYARLKELPNGINCLFLHGQLLELMAWAAQAAAPDYDFSAAEIRELGLTGCTVFMGNLHTYSDYHDPVANNWFIYSGSTEMTEISEGNVVSDRFGGRYDPVKKYVRFYPDREPGQNWETADLPNRPYLKRVISPKEDFALAIQSIAEWVSAHPGGILALHYPEQLRTELKSRLSAWREQLLVFSEVPLSQGMIKPLHELKDTDILQIARDQLTERQLQLLTVVLTQNPFEETLAGLLRPSEVEA